VLLAIRQLRGTLFKLAKMFQSLEFAPESAHWEKECLLRKRGSKFDRLSPHTLFVMTGILSFCKFCIQHWYTSWVKFPICLSRKVAEMVRVFVGVGALALKCR